MSVTLAERRRMVWGACAVTALGALAAGLSVALGGWDGYGVSAAGTVVAVAGLWLLVGWGVRRGGWRLVPGIVLAGCGLVYAAATFPLYGLV